MDKQIVVEESSPSEIAEEIENETNGPVAQADRYDDKVWMDAEDSHKANMVETDSPETPPSVNDGSLTTLLEPDESEHLHARWNEIQGRFVDDPRSSVQQADALVSEVVEKITQMFASEHELLESQWKEGQDVSTEDLRKALQHYRSFFNRLVV